MSRDLLDLNRQIFIVTTGKEEVSGVVPMPAAANNLSHHQFYGASYASFVKSP